MRQEFTAKTKVETFDRQRGYCAHCGVRLSVSVHYDHIIACGIGGDNSAGNCQALCRNCHGAKTTREDVPRIAKAKRNYRKAANIRGERQIRSWRKFDGTPVYASKTR